jgi:hypothetical protein
VIFDTTREMLAMSPSQTPPAPAPPDPVQHLLDLASAVRDMAEEMYRADRRREYLDVRHVRHRCEVRGELLRRIDAAAAVALSWAVAAGVQLDEADGRIGALRTACRAVADWGWQWRGMAPPPLGGDPVEVSDLPELTPRQQQAEAERAVVLAQLQDAAAAVVRLRIAVEARKVAAPPATTPATPARDAPPPPPPARHGRDFRSVNWFGALYSFTGNQAAIVKVLWEEWEKDTPEVGLKTLLADSGVDSDRVQDVFKEKGVIHPAWGAMIIPGKTKGTLRLQPPESAAAGRGKGRSRKSPR